MSGASMTVSRTAVAFVCLLVFVGCSDSYGGRQEITGTVKLKGQPIKDGTVSFEPLEGQGTRASAPIAAGAFKIARASGLVPGKYLIRISAGDGRTPVNPVNPEQPPGPGGGANIISKELVPASWNVNSKEERSVSSDAPNNFEFNVP